MKKYKVEGMISFIGTVQFLNEEELLQSFNDSIHTASIEDIAEHVVVSYVEGRTFIEGVGEEVKDFEIENYDYWTEDIKVEIV